MPTIKRTIALRGCFGKRNHAALICEPAEFPGTEIEANGAVDQIARRRSSNILAQIVADAKFQVLPVGDRPHRPADIAFEQPRLARMLGGDLHPGVER